MPSRRAEPRPRARGRGAETPRARQSPAPLRPGPSTSPRSLLVKDKDGVGAPKCRVFCRPLPGVPMTRSRSIPLGAVCLLALIQTVGAQNAALPGDWLMYRRDAAGTGHSPLAQITTANVSRLARVWTYRLQAEGAPNVNSQ